MLGKKRKILILGGGFALVPAIEYAKSAGYHTITCDYLPQNPGHRYSDEYHNISIIEKEKVVELAKRLDVDGVLGYSSDILALTAAYVSEELNLPGASYDSVFTLCRKDYFRRLLKENGFNCNGFVVIETIDEIDSIERLEFPLVVKPVDASGSNGVSIVESAEGLREAAIDAFSFSRCGNVIIEEYIGSDYPQIHGDGFVLDGELVFLGLCDQLLKGRNPICSVYPSSVPQFIQDYARNEIQRVIGKAGFRNGAINVEMRIAKDYRVYILEIGPRSGGNCVPQLMELATGFREVKAIIDFAMGEIVSKEFKVQNNNCLHYKIWPENSGIFEGIEFDFDFKKLIEKIYINRVEGEMVNASNNAADVVGVVIARYESREKIESIMDGLSKCVKAKIQDN